MREMTRREAIIAGAGAAASASIFADFASAAEAFPIYGGPPEFEGITLPYPSVFTETQCWWVQGRAGLAAPDPDFPFTSAHVHLGIGYGLGERISKIDGEWRFPFVGQLHEFVGGHGKNIRGGGFQMGSPIPSVPCSPALQNPSGPNVRQFGWLTNTRSPAAGLHENRFTLDTISPNAKRQYQSGAWNAYVDAPGQPVTVTARGWYEATGYTNVTLKTKVAASSLSTNGLPSTLAYALAQGATFAFAYIDPNIHGGSKGTVLFENRTGSSGTFNLPALAPGPHVLLLGGWEKSSTGWNAGVLRLPFNAG